MMTKISTLTALALLLATLPAPAPAAVVCKKKSGTLSVRDACKKKETAVDLSPFGTARAYACSSSGNGLTAFLCSGLPVKNVTSVVANGSNAGYTCFVLDSSIDASTALPVASLNGTSNFSLVKVDAVVSAAGVSNFLGCPPNSVAVLTAQYTDTGTLLSLEPTILGVNLAVY